MSHKDAEEFEVALKDIAYTAIRLKNEYDRVRCCQWLRKLISLPVNKLETLKLRNDYIQYLRIILRTGLLHGIFLKLPPAGDLRPLPELLGQDMVRNIPELPEVGPIAPYMQHRTNDGRAYVAIKKIPGKGVFCYMAVAPQSLTE